MDEQVMEPVLVDVKCTPLHSLHLELGARMVNFAGYDMPVQYLSGIKSEHEHTRTSAGLFDISHMGQIRIEGDDVAARLEILVPADIKSLSPYQQRYSLLTNRNGGIIDDLMITRMPDHFFLVVNASRKELDFNYLKEALKPCRVTALTDRGLLALQGSQAAAVLGRLHADVLKLPFLGAAEFQLAGIRCLVHRCGYTGEDGFEISMAASQTELLTRMLLEDPAVKPVGLGARDSLRLESGLCLYGHELDEHTTPVEAGLSWTISKKYRSGKTEPARFPGAGKILGQLINGPDRMRLGFRPEGKIPVREGTTIFDSEGINVGIITSGGYGQTIGGPVAMGYVTTGSSQNTEYKVEIRNQTHKIFSVELPFVKHRYYKSPR